MRQGKKEFRILDGFRYSALKDRAGHGSSSPPNKEESFVHRQEAGGKGLMDALRTMEQRLSSLLEDRTRLGRDLHDSVLQSLYAIGLNIETVRREHPRITTDSQQTHAHIVEHINRLIHEIRQMIRGLNQGVVQEFELAAELHALKTVYDQLGRVRITLDLQPSAIEILTKEEEREILNIAREAFSNCVRHANAAHAAISIRKLGDRIRVRISDDGKGFAMGNSQPRGYGLANMAARAKKLGGVLRIQSQEGRGTEIITEFSLEPMLAPV